MFYEVADESDLSVDVRTSETSRTYIFIYFLTNRKSIKSLKDETFLISYNTYLLLYLRNNIFTLYKRN